MKEQTSESSESSESSEVYDREVLEAVRRVGPRPSETLLTVTGREKQRAWLRAIALEAPPAAKASLLKGLMQLIKGPPTVENFAAKIAMLQIADWLEEAGETKLES